MSDLSNSGVIGAFVPLAVLGASLVGSLHCVSMCGGLVMAVAPTGRAVLLYHLGRLLGYVFLGLLAGALGGQFLSAAQGVGPWLGAVGLGLGFVFIGVRVWKGKAPHLALPKRFERSRLALLKGASGTAFTAGLASFLLPCGWLHSFVLGAVATGSPLKGMGFLACFWLGTLPALSATPVLIHRLLMPISLRAPKVSGAVLVIAGLFAMGAKATPLVLKAQQGEVVTCPHHAQSGD